MSSIIFQRLCQFALVTATLAVAACATPAVIDTERPEDTRLSCTQLEDRMAEADRFRRDAERDKGVTGKNVAAVLFFWPALLATYSNVQDAVRAADERKRYLMRIYAGKHCG